MTSFISSRVPCISYGSSNIPARSQESTNHEHRKQTNILLSLERYELKSGLILFLYLARCLYFFIRLKKARDLRASSGSARKGQRA
jgi:hypothetical protein